MRQSRFLSLVVLLSALLPVSRVALADEKPLSLVVVMDGSGSMQKTDPDDLAKLAAQALVALLDEGDQVAVVEFATDAKVRSTWIEADRKGKVREAVRAVRKDGETDYLLGLHKALGLFGAAQQDRRRLVLFLTDGILEPSPDNYPGIAEDAVAGHVRGRLQAETVPAYRKAGVEIFAVGLSDKADQALLDELAEGTSLDPREVHSFHAENASALLEAFLSILTCVRGAALVEASSGDVRDGGGDLYVDGLFKTPRFLVLTDSRVDAVTFEPPAGRKLQGDTGIHKFLHLLEPASEYGAGTWKYRFGRGSGRYSLLVVGHSDLTIRPEGLQELYWQGDPLDITVHLEDGTRNVTPDLSSETRVEARMNGGEPPVVLERQGDSFRLRQPLERKGRQTVSFVVRAYEEGTGRALLTRSSREFAFEVLERPELFLLGLAADYPFDASVTATAKLQTEAGLLHPDSFVRCTHSSSSGKDDLRFEGAAGTYPLSFAARPPGDHRLACELSGWRKKDHMQLPRLAAREEAFRVGEPPLPPLPELTLEVEGLKPTYEQGEVATATVRMKLSSGDADKVVHNGRVESQWTDSTGTRTVRLDRIGGGTWKLVQPLDAPGPRKVSFYASGTEAGTGRAFPRGRGPEKSFEVSDVPAVRLDVDGARAEYEVGSTVQWLVKPRLERDGWTLSDDTQVLALVRAEGFEHRIGLERTGDTWVFHLEPGNTGDYEVTLSVEATDRTRGAKLRQDPAVGTVQRFTVIPTADTAFERFMRQLWALLQLIAPIAGVVIFLLLLAYLLWIWGALGEPQGVLRVTKAPDGSMQSFKLSDVKEGFFRRWLSPNRHLVSIGGSVMDDIKLKRVPADCQVELRFFRFYKSAVVTREPERKGPGGPSRAPAGGPPSAKELKERMKQLRAGMDGGARKPGAGGAAAAGKGGDNPSAPGKVPGPTPPAAPPAVVEVRVVDPQLKVPARRARLRPGGRIMIAGYELVYHGKKE